MEPPPSFVALTFCNRLIVDEVTKMRSLIDVITGISVGDFPSAPQRFYVHAALTGGVGEARIELRVIRLATSQQVYSQFGKITFPDRTDIVSPFFHVRSIRFPAPGFYLCQLLVGGELLSGAERRIRVFKHEEST